MVDSVLNSLITLSLPKEIAGRFRIAPGPLRLKKSWPRAADHLSLEYVSSDGSTIPGQWFENPERYRKVAQQTCRAINGSQARVARLDNRNILLQAKGADRKLPGLAPLLDQPGSSIVAHRPERRAVVKLRFNQESRFAKVVRTNKVAALIENGCRMNGLKNNLFGIPSLLDWNRQTGVTLWSELPGDPLYTLIQNGWTLNNSHNNGGAKVDSSAFATQFTTIFRSAGRALQALHKVPPKQDMQVHGYGSEIKTLRKWVDSIRLFWPALFSNLNARLLGTIKKLEETETAHVLIHRDFYDKQVLVTKNGGIGFLDFDTLSIGEAAVDLANALAHIELRVIQNRFEQEKAELASAAFLTGYDPDRQVRRRLPAYADASRLRLACVYATRPQEGRTVSGLLDRIGEPVMGMSRISN
jgi:aminoglycoside phosphotransferase